jgi:hypothetical protein
MFSRRIALTMLGAVLILCAGAVPASAAGPTRARPAAERPPFTGERPLTSDEWTASDRKIAAALAYLAAPEARAAVTRTLACVTPDGSPPSALGSIDAQASGLGDQTTSGCEVPHGFLAVSARDQTRGHYCGPAVGQVIANYTWAVPLDANKYTQRQLAVWMGTDVTGGTSAYAMADGLDRATLGAPRRPAQWDWVVTQLTDTDRDGAVSDQLHDYVRANVSGSKMALAISVKPHDVNGRFHLSSWPKPVNSPGHWITGYGWWGLYDGTDSSRMLYTDSSKDEGGATGSFWDPMRHIAGMIKDHTGRFVW